MVPGEVRLVYFPFSEHEDEKFKKRPVLVLRAMPVTASEPVVLVAMVTASAARVARPRPGDVVIADWAGAGLVKPSVVRTRRLWTAERRDFTGNLLGSVGPQVLHEVIQYLRQLLQ